MRSLTYVEVDLSFCTLRYGETTGAGTCPAVLGVDSDIKCFNSVKTCAVPASYIDGDVTLRFSKPSDFLPREIECIPSISDISFTPATISLGKDLGTRATLQVTFIDHPHSDTGDGYDKYLSDRAYDPYSQGTFWGKFRARQPFLFGRSIRLITGLVGDDIADMETRHFIIESFDGPTPDGKYTILAKDFLKLADGDKAQAPVLSNGFLVADITAVATTATLSPAGIGNAEYPTGGSDYLVIGGNEVVQYTRSGDVLTMTRAQLGTVAVTHKAQDRVQVVLSYAGVDAADIVKDLMVTYAGVPSGYITLSDWQAETAAFLGNVYTAHICEPTSVANLVSELIEQAALAIWDDNIEQKLRLQVLRAVVTDADTFTPDNTLQGTLNLKEQPQTRLSRVQVYFAQIDPTKPLSNLGNFRSTSLSIDEDAEASYGSAAIKTILSRWIPAAGRSVADRLGAVQLGRFRDPPRHVGFAVQRYAETDAALGVGYRVESFCVQDPTGAQSDIPIQVTRLNPAPDRFTVEAEEMLFTAPAADTGTHTIIFDSNLYNINLRTSHDSIYPTPQSGDLVICNVNAGVVIGSVSAGLPALDIGSWPAGVTIQLNVFGKIQGKGGYGGEGAQILNAAAGGPGGNALYTRYSISLDISSGGKIWGGGGGGGGGAGGNRAGSNIGGGGGGGGGAGAQPGPGSLGGYSIYGHGGDGAGGTELAGGLGGPGESGIPGFYFPAGAGAPGGGPGVAGPIGGAFGAATPAAGGLAGPAIDGMSHIALTLGSGSILGAMIN